MPKARYTKLSDLIAKIIEDGTLPPGSKLPTHRKIAAEYGVAVATATRAYAELERRGLIVGEPGRGMFVRDPGLPLTLGIEQTVAEGLVDLVFNMPSDAGDADMLRAGLKRLATAGDLKAMLKYQPHGGRPHERRIIAASLKKALGAIAPERLLITSGGQHGLAITALGLLQRGDVVATDPLTYPGFKSVATLHGLTLLPVSPAEGAMDPDDLERRAERRKLKAIYLMPTVHNPLGTIMSEDRRHRLIEIARKHDLLIFEDSAYAFLEPDPPPSFVELAPERTVHIGGYSKSLATGLRLGYLVAPDTQVDQLSNVIRATTWNAPALISALVIGWIEDGSLARSQETRRRDGARRQRLCRNALTGSDIISHKNAEFAWVPLKPTQRAEPIVSGLNDQGVSVSAAAPYAVTDASPQALRLAFGGISDADLIPALEKVSEAITGSS